MDVLSKVLRRGWVRVVPLQNVKTFDDHVTSVTEDDLHLAAVHIYALSIQVLARVHSVCDGSKLHESSGGSGLDDDANLLDWTKVAKHLLNDVDCNGILHVGDGDDKHLGGRGCRRCRFRRTQIVAPAVIEIDAALAKKARHLALSKHCNSMIGVSLKLELHESHLFARWQNNALRRADTHCLQHVQHLRLVAAIGNTAYMQNTARSIIAAALGCGLGIRSVWRIHKRTF